MFLGSMGVLSCEVALPFLPCLPGGSHRAYKLHLWPGPQLTWARILKEAVSGDGAVQALPAVRCAGASGQGRPLSADTWLPVAVLCPPAWAASTGSSPRSLASYFILLAWYFIIPGPHQRPLSGQGGFWEGHRGSSSSSSALTQAAAGSLVAEMRM